MTLVSGVPRDSHELVAVDQLRSLLLAPAVPPGRGVFAPRPHERGLQGVRRVRHVSKPGQIRALLEPGLGAIVQGVERAEEAEQRQSGRAQVLPVHEGGQGRPGWGQVRGSLLQLRDRAGRSKSEAESGDARHLSGHRQTGAREEVVRYSIDEFFHSILRDRRIEQIFLGRLQKVCVQSRKEVEFDSLENGTNFIFEISFF